MQMAVGGLSGPSLVPVSLEAREAISTPFEIRLEFVSDVPRLAADAFLYRPVLVTLRRNVPAPRYFHGAARRFTTLGPDKRDNWHYAIDIVPQIWFMQQTENCRFFENCSVKDIVSTLLGNIGVGFSFRLHETPAVREYTVQYNETDFAFISRLLEEEGYFYFFQHSPDGHELVIAESNIAFQTIPDSKLTFRPGQKDYNKLATLHAWTATAVGSVTLGDYDPTGVNKPLPGTETTILGASGSSARVVYHWPALAFDTGDVAARARRRIEAAEAFAALSEGESWNEGFVPGGTFTLAEDPLTGQHDTSFVIRNVEHRATSPYRLSASGETSGEIESFYENRFGAFPSTTPWRQPLTVPRPRMAGLYSAVVIGPPGEEIYHDKFARIKVQFPWSHLDDTTPGGALWVRVIKGWAGGGWGTQFIPRIGTEVAVAFIDGDPDRPVVVGGLYNAGSDPLYDPSEKNKTGWRSRSTPGGSQSNYSEVTIDDTMGAERLFLHAERDFVGEVEHDQTLTVDNCRIVSVGQNEQRTIGVNQTTKIGSNEVFTVGANSTRTIGSNYVTKVGVNRTTSVGTDDSLKVGTNRTTTIGADHLLEIGTNQTTTIGTGNTLKVGANQNTTIGAGDMTQVGTNHVLKVGEAQSFTIGTSQSIKVGTAQTVEVGTGQSTTATTGDIALTASTGAIQIAASAGSVGISAAQMIQLSVGPSSISITPMGVDITGLMVNVDGVMVSFMSVLYSILGALVMVEGALVTINSGFIPGGSSGGAVSASVDAGEAVVDEAGAAGRALQAAAGTGSDVDVAAMKAASSAALRTGAASKLADAAGAAFSKLSAAVDKATSAASAARQAASDARAAAAASVREKGILQATRDGLGTAYDKAGDGIQSARESELAARNRVGVALKHYHAKDIVELPEKGMELYNSEQKQDDEKSLNNSENSGDEDDSDATVKLSPKQAAAATKSGSKSNSGSGPS